MVEISTVEADLRMNSASDDKSIQQKAIKQVESSLRYLYISIENDDQKWRPRNNESSHNYLKTSIIFKDRECNYRQVLIWTLVNLSLVYIAIKFVLLSWLHFEHDKLLESIWFRSPYNDLDKLCLIDDKKINSISNSLEFKRLLDLEQQIYSLGSSSPSLIGFNSINYSIATMSILSFYFITRLYIYLVRPKLDIKHFITDRLETLLKLEMKYLIQTLFHCRIIDLDGNKKNCKYEYSIKYDIIQFCKQSDLKSYDLMLNDRDRFNNCTLKMHYDYVTEVNIFTLDGRLEDQIKRDKQLNDWWRNIVCHQLYHLPATRLCLSSIPALAVLVLPFIEIYLRMVYRLELIRCQSASNTSSILMQTPMQLLDLTSRAHLDAYINYKPTSIMDQLELFVIESKEYLTLNVIVTHLQLFVVFTLAAILSWPLFILLYIYKYGANYIWLRQIGHQMNDCISRITKTISGQRNDLAENKAREEILKLITITYLNYEHFRRHQKDYHDFTALAMMQTTMLELLALPVCFIPALMIKNAYNYVPCFLITYLTAYLNAYFISSSILTGKMLRIQKDICRLAALANDCSLRRAPIMKLWSAQLLSREISIRSFAPRVFGLTIAYDKIIPLNVYISVLWYITLYSS